MRLLRQKVLNIETSTGRKKKRRFQGYTAYLSANRGCGKNLNKSCALLSEDERDTWSADGRSKTDMVEEKWQQYAIYG